MFEIIKLNERTFHAYDSEDKGSSLARVLAFSLVAIVISIGNWIEFSDIFEPILASYSVLAGFSFSVMFFLASYDHIRIPKDVSIEDKIKVRRMQNLGRELFYNVSYFNMISISVVVLSIIVFFEIAMIFSQVLVFAQWLSIGVTDAAVQAVVSLSGWVERTIFTLLVFLIFEGLFTFVRTSMRAFVFFRRKVEISEKVGTSTGV